MKKIGFQCVVCRQRKEVEKNVCGMNYCAGCAHKAPSPAEFKRYLHSNSSKSYFEEGNDRRSNGYKMALALEFR